MPNALLYCPVRGEINATALAKDGLTTTEEARRIDFLHYLLHRKYPPDNIRVETVVLTRLGSQGRNTLRTDVIVYNIPVSLARKLPDDEHLTHAFLVAEIKRDSSTKTSGIKSQLLPAMKQLPSMDVLGVYWDDVNRILFTKSLVTKNGGSYLQVNSDSLASLPPFGQQYKSKPITVDTLTAPTNLVGTLFHIANILRSHGINDEHLRYKETVKLLLARYCDEKQARESLTKELILQAYEGTDPGFLKRVKAMYGVAAKRYGKAQSLFKPMALSELDEAVLRDVVKSIQGIDFSSASSETMQQVFMSFVPTVFKDMLDQYFTPLSLIDTAVAMTSIGPNDTVADPAMGTGDFLTSAMAYRASRGDDDIIQRIFGLDIDQKAYDLAIINMILNKDGQANLFRKDSLKEWDLWKDERDVVLCNPPFGARTVENRPEVLRHYDLGHIWIQDDSTGEWVKTDAIRADQQLGILFIERCYEMLSEGGRLAIIVPEGYLCTQTYGYVRQWLTSQLQILSVVELPRRIFLKSDADLRSNILVAQKLSAADLKTAITRDYPIHADLVRKVGYKLGAGFTPIAMREDETGLEIRDSNNQLVLDSDFNRVRRTFERFRTKGLPNEGTWGGARIRDILSHPRLDMKPRRLMPKALRNLRTITTGNHVRLGDVAEVIEETIDIITDVGSSKYLRLVEGQGIRAIEGTVIPHEPQRCWMIAARKSRNLYRLKYRDVIVGLVRPERRNIGLLLTSGDDLVGSPDGIAVIRPQDATESLYPAEWIFSSLRSEACRLQLWTESGGTSYGKLTAGHIQNVLLPIPPEGEREAICEKMKKWAKHTEQALQEWGAVGSEADRKPIMNSPVFGLESDDFDYMEEEE